MARRENQGIQIAMIVFILLTLVFMLTTYFGYSASTRLQGEVDSLQSEVNTARDSVRSAETLSSGLKTRIGFDPGMDDAEVGRLVEESVTSTFGQGLAEENQTFLGIIQELNNQVTKLTAELASSNKSNQDLREKMLQDIATEQKKLADARANETKAQEDFNTVTNEAQASRSQLEATAQKFQDAANKANADKNTAVAKAEQERDAAASALGSKEEIIKIRTRERDELLVDTPDQYDGKILGVVAATKTVLINRGRADGVRAKMTFSVYDADDMNARTAKKKASLEVTRVLGDHRAEARITQINHVDPPISNDHIATPAWSPGESLGFALVGKMDIDKDGLDDREEVRLLITRGGGRIDAEEVVVDSGGDKTSEVTGSVSVETRYVVVGDGALLGKGLLQQADDFSVERLSVSELLDLLGSTSRARAVTYDGTLRPGDFAPKSDSVRRRMPASTNFRPRTPLRRRAIPRTQ